MEELITLIKEISPEVWAILIKQTYITASKDLGISIVLGIASYVAFIKKDKLDDEIILWLVAAVCAGMSVAFLTSSIMWFINPEFYAIRFLLSHL